MTDRTIGGGWMIRFELDPEEEVVASFPAVIGGVLSMSYEGKAYVTDRRIIWLRYRSVPFGTNSAQISYNEIRRCKFIPDAVDGDGVVLTLWGRHEMAFLAADSMFSAFLLQAAFILPVGKLFGSRIASSLLYEEIEKARQRFESSGQYDPQFMLESPTTLVPGGTRQVGIFLVVMSLISMAVSIPVLIGLPVVYFVPIGVVSALALVVGIKMYRTVEIDTEDEEADAPPFGGRHGHRH